MKVDKFKIFKYKCKRAERLWRIVRNGSNVSVGVPSPLRKNFIPSHLAWEYSKMQKDWVKIIYMGLPGEFNPETSDLKGPASWIASIYFNGHLMEYEGSYWKALWYWIKGEEYCD